MKITITTTTIHIPTLIEDYIKDIIKIFKNETNEIVCAYLYNIQNILMLQHF